MQKLRPARGGGKDFPHSISGKLAVIKMKLLHKRCQGANGTIGLAHIGHGIGAAICPLHQSLRHQTRLVSQGNLTKAEANERRSGEITIILHTHIIMDVVE